MPIERQMLIMRVILHIDISMQREVQDVLLVLELEEIMSPVHAPLTSSGAGGPVGHWLTVGLQHVCALVLFFQMCLYQANAGSVCYLQTVRYLGAFASPRWRGP